MNNETSTITGAAAPEWRQIPGPVHCGRCSALLNGTAGSNCPQCELSLDWAELVPQEHICCLHCHYQLLGLREQRCPECGQEFD